MKPKLGKEALIIAIMTLITILTWIGLEVYRTVVKTTIPEVTQEQMAPLNPKIKTETIDSLKANLSFSEAELNVATQTAVQPEEQLATESGASSEED